MVKVEVISCRVRESEKALFVRERIVHVVRLRTARWRESRYTASFHSIWPSLQSSILSLTLWKAISICLVLFRSILFFEKSIADLLSQYSWWGVLIHSFSPNSSRNIFSYFVFFALEIYSAFIVDIAMHFVDAFLSTTFLPIIIIFPKYECPSSGFLARSKFASLQINTFGSSLLYVRLWFFIVPKYLRVPFALFQCFLLRLDENWANFETTNTISGLVHWLSYSWAIQLIRDMVCFSCLVFPHLLLANLSTKEDIQVLSKYILVDILAVYTESNNSCMYLS